MQAGSDAPAALRGMLGRIKLGGEDKNSVSVWDALDLSQGRPLVVSQNDLEIAKRFVKLGFR
jgi:hypothetical protein